MKPRSNPLSASLIGIVLCVSASMGCKKETQEPAPEPTTGAEAPTPEPVPEPDPVALSEAECELPIVYFAFDSSELDEDARAALHEAVECVRRQTASFQLRLTGACDPRGTEEYNLALGERRAAAVRNYMQSLGADTSQMTTTSVGEEMATGRDEAGWAQDRNVTATGN